jgi:hypothetical protein
MNHGCGAFGGARTYRLCEAIRSIVAVGNDA